MADLVRANSVMAEISGFERFHKCLGGICVQYFLSTYLVSPPIRAGISSVQIDIYK